jgi:3-isopropylmalate/(R)-2-methylmalate dehydratase small subunit
VASIRREDDELPVMTGRAWVFADRLLAREIAASAAPQTLFRALDPDLASRLSPGDVLVAGSECAIGDGARDAARALRAGGMAVVIARSFAPEFFDEALAVGLPAVAIDETQMIRTGDRLRVDLEGRKVANLSSGDRYPIRELDDETVLLLRMRVARE